MLVLTRKPGEKIIVGNLYQIEIAAVSRGVVKFVFNIDQPITLMPGNIGMDFGSDEFSVERKVDDSVLIGDDPSSQIEVLVVSVKGEAVRVGVKAPREVTVHREEVWSMIQESNIAASQMPDVDTSQFKKLFDKKPAGSPLDRPGDDNSDG